MPRGTFHIQSMLHRLQEFASGAREDPWAELAATRQWLTKAILSQFS